MYDRVHDHVHGHELDHVHGNVHDHENAHGAPEDLQTVAVQALVSGKVGEVVTVVRGRPPWSAPV